MKKLEELFDKSEIKESELKESRVSRILPSAIHHKSNSIT